MTNSTSSHPNLTSQVRSRFLSMYRDDPTGARLYLGEKLGVKRSQRDEWARKILREEGAGNMPDSEGGMSGDGSEGRQKIGDSFDVDVEVSRAKTLEEVIELCAVDKSEWEPKGFSVTRKKNGFGWNARFVRRAPVLDTQLVAAAFESAAKRHAPKKWTLQSDRSKNRDCLYLLNIQDLHLAKLATSRETGDADWDIRIAEKTFNAAVEDLMKKAPQERIEEVIVIVGSDMLQIDNDSSQTRAGTYVDSDSRLSKAFDVCATMVTQNVEKLASHFRVRVVVIPGNHDTTVSLYLGYYVAAWFRNHPNVIVDNEPKSRKYVPYGKTLIGFDHGSDTKRTDLPLTMMRENQEIVSQFRYFEMITGHLHKDSSDEIHGVKVRIAPALCAADKWHASHAFVGNIKTSQGLLYQRDNGIEAIYYSTPLN